MIAVQSDRGLACWLDRLRPRYAREELGCTFGTGLDSQAAGASPVRTLKCRCEFVSPTRHLHPGPMTTGRIITRLLTSAGVGKGRESGSSGSGPSFRSCQPGASVPGTYFSLSASHLLPEHRLRQVSCGGGTVCRHGFRVSTRIPRSSFCLSFLPTLGRECPIFSPFPTAPGVLPSSAESGADAATGPPVSPRSVGHYARGDLTDAAEPVVAHDCLQIPSPACTRQDVRRGDLKRHRLPLSVSSEIDRRAIGTCSRIHGDRFQ